MIQRGVLFFFIAIVLLSFVYAEVNYKNPALQKLITGRSITGEAVTGRATSDYFNVSISVNDMLLTIYSPQNTTYNFDNSDTLAISLNVSVSGMTPTNWNYTLENLKHSVIVNNSVVFTPNTTIYPYRYQHMVRVYVTDGVNVLNGNVTFYVNVSNSPPVLNTVNHVYACEDSSLSYFYNATDIDEDSLTFTRSPAGLFLVSKRSENISIGGTFSVAELFTPTLTYPDIGDYNGIDEPVRNISVADDHSPGPLSDYRMVNISVLETNRAPVITDVSNQSISFTGSTQFYLAFNATDQAISPGGEDGTQDDGLLSFNITNLTGNLILNMTGKAINSTITASQSGNYTFRVCVTDTGIDNPHQNLSVHCGQTGGNLSDCTDFNMTVTGSEIFVEPSSGGGGGGGGGSGGCAPKWGCIDWNNCERADFALQTGLLNGEAFRVVSGFCAVREWGEEYCGYQTRICNDVNNCNSTYNKPEAVQACFYTSDPSCYDDIKNCHDGGCEVLVDCGGPCDVCPICSDGIQNQGEEGVDCGGPCPNLCLAFASPEIEREFGWIELFIFLLFLIVLTLVIWLLILLRRRRKEDE